MHWHERVCGTCNRVAAWRVDGPTSNDVSAGSAVGAMLDAHEGKLAREIGV